MGSDGASEDAPDSPPGDAGDDRPGRRDDDQSSESDDDSTGRRDETDSFEFESYYELLGVPEDATTEEIERAYRELAKRHHPDASEHPERVAERRFRQLLTARDVLTSVERRRAYDELGHEEYRRQSESLGEPVRRGDTDGSTDRDGETAPEPRPEPGTSVDRPGQAQRSARGEAHRRGDPLVTSTEEAFGGPATRASERSGTEGPGASERDPASGRGIYRLVFEDGPLETRSLQYVAARWARSWRTRTAVGVGSVVLAAGVLAALPGVLDTVGVDIPVPDLTAGTLYPVALGAVLAHTAYSCGASEARLPRGQFLTDRDHGRFSMATSRTYQRRGVVALALVFVLAVASARNGVSPWVHTADALRGDLSGPVAWVDASGTSWTTVLDAALTGTFALAAVLGTLALSVGVSIALWRGRYEQGLRVRPSLWEPVLVVALVSTLFALVAGPVALVSLPMLSALPETVALAAGVDGSTVTVATVAVAGIVLALASVPLSRLRFALASERGEAEKGGRAEAD